MPGTPRAQANGIELAYETFGDPGDPALLLVAGLGRQLTSWPEQLCRELAGSGLHVIRYDNRDSGLSTCTPEEVPPTDWHAVLSRDYTSVTYRVADLTDDATGLLDSLGIERAHVAGVSMGGMIAQQLAISAPERVLSLCSIMSTTGARGVGKATDEAAAMLFAPQARERAAAIAQGVRVWQLLGSPDHPTDAETLWNTVAAEYDRAHRPEGTARQLAAIMASPDRTEALAGVSAPCLVVHGEADPLIGVSGGRATAEAVPGARLLAVPGMGHDLPRQLWEMLAREITEHTRQAGGTD